MLLGRYHSLPHVPCIDSCTESVNLLGFMLEMEYFLNKKDNLETMLLLSLKYQMTTKTTPGKKLSEHSKKYCKQFFVLT